MKTTPLPAPEAIALTVRRAIAETLRVPLETVGPDTSLDAIDSLGLVKLNVILEEKLEVALPEFVPTEAGLPRSVREVIALVERHVDASRAGAAA